MIPKISDSYRECLFPHRRSFVLRGSLQGLNNSINLTVHRFNGSSFTQRTFVVTILIEIINAVTTSYTTSDHARMRFIVTRTRHGGDDKFANALTYRSGIFLFRNSSLRTSILVMSTVTGTRASARFALVDAGLLQFGFASALIHRDEERIDHEDSI